MFQDRHTQPLLPNMYFFLKNTRKKAVLAVLLLVAALNPMYHGLRTPIEEIAFTAQPKINSQSQIFRYAQSIFCLPHQPKFSDFFDLCLHWVSVVRDPIYC